jgi:hypothetical protein
MSTCPRMETDQAMGPHRPTVAQLIERLSRLPAHNEVEAVIINGQRNRLFVITYHEGLIQESETNCHD